MDIAEVSKVGLYKKSLKLSLWYFNNDRINKKNDKRDFRFYKVFSDKYYKLGDFKNFKKFLKITVKKFLNFSDIHIKGFGDNFILNLENSKIYFFDNFILENKYNSFFEYNKKYILSDLDRVIFSINFLYKEKILGEQSIDFLDTRGIEKNCFNYLKYIYEGK